MLSHEKKVIEDYKLVKNIKTSHLFKLDLESLWNFVKDTNETSKINCGSRTRVIFTKGENSYTQDAEFYFEWKSVTKIIVTILEVKESTNEKRIVAKILRQPENEQLTVIYYLCEVTPYYTLFEIENIFDGQGKCLNPSQEKKLNDELKELLLSYEKFLLYSRGKTYSHRSLQKYNIEPKALFSLISDWRKLAKVFPNIFEEIFYKGEPENVGTVISLIWKDDLKFF